MLYVHRQPFSSDRSILPKFQQSLTIIIERMLAGAIEAMRVPATRSTSSRSRSSRCAPSTSGRSTTSCPGPPVGAVRRMSRPVLESVLDMLAGRYPQRRVRRAAAAAGVGPRVRHAHRPSGRPAPGRHLGRHDPRPRAVRGVPGRPGRAGSRGSASSTRRWSTSRGSVTSSPWARPAGASRTSPTTASSSRRLRDCPGRLPFWKGDSLGRPPELGRAVGAFVREVEALSPDAGRTRVMAAGLDEWAADNLLTYLREQREATGHVPDDRTIVVERFRDELGDWRIAVHSPFGAQVHAPWALAVAAGCATASGSTCRRCTATTASCCACPTSSSTGDGVVGRVAGVWVGSCSTSSPSTPTTSATLVTEEIGGSALFAARFRECAARALLLPRRRPDRRQPLWQQRQRASQLLEVASQYPSFPIVLEAVRECVQDVFDVPGLVDLMRDIAARRVTVVDVESSTALAVRQVAALRVRRPVPLRRRLPAGRAPGRGPGPRSPACSRSCSARARGWPCATCSTPSDRPHRGRAAAPQPRAGGPRRRRRARPPPLARAAVHRRHPGPVPGGHDRRRRRVLARRPPGGPPGHRGPGCRGGPMGRDRGRLRLRDALGVSLPPGVPQTFLEPVTRPARRPRGAVRADACARSTRTRSRGPTASDRPWRPRPSPASCRPVGSSRASCCRRVVAAPSTATPRCCGCCADGRWRRCAPRSSLSPPSSSQRFLQGWQGVGGGMRGRDGLRPGRRAAQRGGAARERRRVTRPARPRRRLLPRSARRAHGHGRGAVVRPRLAARRRRLGLAPPRRLRPPHPSRARPRAGSLRAGHRGPRRPGRRGRPLLPHAERPRRVHGRRSPRDHPLGPRLVRPGHRRHLRAGPGAARRWPHGTPQGPDRTSQRPGMPVAADRSVGSARQRHAPCCRAGPGRRGSRGGGRCVPPVELDPTVRAYATAELLLDRHGILTRGAVGRRGRPRRVRGGLPGAGAGGGGRAGAPRVLRRGPRRVAVRHRPGRSTGCAVGSAAAPPAPRPAAGGRRTPVGGRARRQ